MMYLKILARTFLGLMLLSSVTILSAEAEENQSYPTDRMSHRRVFLLEGEDAEKLKTCPPAKSGELEERLELWLEKTGEDKFFATFKLKCVVKSMKPRSKEVTNYKTKSVLFLEKEPVRWNAETQRFDVLFGSSVALMGVDDRKPILSFYFVDAEEPGNELGYFFSRQIAVEFDRGEALGVEKEIYNNWTY